MSATDETLRDGTQSPRGEVKVLRDYPRPAPGDHVPFPREAVDGSVPARFEAQARLHAHRTALRTPSREWSYAALNASANRVAHALLQPAATGPSPVALLMDQEDPAVPALLGVLKSGRPYVFLDPGDPARRWEDILDATGAGLLVTTRARLPQAGAVRTGGLLCWEDLDAGPEAGDPGLEIAPDTPAAFFFTSGSTGKPKGLVRDHRQFLQSTWHNTNTYYVSPSDRQSLLYFPGFAASMPNIYDTLLNGATLCALNPKGLPPKDLLAWVRDEGITHFNPPVGLWRGFLAAVPPGADVPVLRLVTLCGQQIYGEDVRGFQSRFGHVAVLDFLLGMTEAGPVARAYFDHTVEAVDGPVPAGYPVADKEISILDAAGRPVGPGVEGRVAITSAFVSRGYWGDEALTARHFLPVEGDPQRLTVLTADRGLLRPDGCLEFFGRDDSVVKIRGYRVDVAAVEAVLNGHPGILGAAVAAGVWRGREPALAAYVVPRGEALSRSEIRAFVAARLSAYMVPDHVLFLDEMPMTTNGKIDRRALPAPGRERPGLDTPFVAPRDGTEARLAEIWAGLFELDEIGVDDGFFDLGGDSLLAMRMALAVEEAFGWSVPAGYFADPTIAALARAMGDGTRGDVPAGGSQAGSRHDGRGPGPARQSLCQLAFAGPVWRDRCLPYGLGVRLQRAMVALPAFRRRFADRLPLLRQWADELGLSTDLEELGTICMLANTWRAWRAKSLERPGISGSWLRISDPNAYLAGRGLSGGVVLAMPHAGRVGGALLGMFERSGRETAIVANDLWLGLDDGTDAWKTQQIKARSEMIWRARQVLQRGGAVYISPDGLEGRQTVEAPFAGRRRPFQIGAAELAVTTGAALVPAYARFDAEGRIWVDVTTALPAEGETRQDRITDLTLRYAREYSERWPQFFASMNWRHLEYNLGLPKL